MGNPPSLLDRLRPHVRVIEWYAWGIWLSFVVITALTADAAANWFALAAYHAATALYNVFLFHVLIQRYADRPWFYYINLTYGVVFAVFSIRLAGLVGGALDVLLALLVVVAAITGSRRLAVYTMVLCWLASLLLIDFSRPPLAVALETAVRLVVFVALGALVLSVMRRIEHQAQQTVQATVSTSRRAARQLSQMQSLHEMAIALGGSLELPVVLDLALAKVLEALHMDAAFIALVDEETQVLEIAAHAGIPAPLVEQARQSQLRSGEGLLGAVVAEGRPLHSTNLPTDTRARYRFFGDAGFVSYIGIPLKSGARVFGAMSMLARRAHTPDATELEFLGAVGEQVGLAVQHARSYASEHAQRQLAEAFNRVAQMVGAGENLEATLESILRELQRIVPYTRAAILLSDTATSSSVERRSAARRDAGRGAVTDPDDLPPSPALTRGALCGYGAELTAEQIANGAGDGVPVAWDVSPTPIICGDLRGEPSWRAPAGLEQVRSRAWTKLATPDGMRGVLIADHEEPNRFGAGDAHVLAAFAQQAVAAVDRARLEAQAQRRLQQLDVLYRVGQAISAALELPLVLQTAYEQVAALTGNRDFFIALYDRALDEVRFPLYYEKGQAIRRPPRRRGNGLTEHVLRTRKPVRLDDDSGTFEREHGIDMLGTPAQSWLGVPLLKGTRVIGAMAVQDFERPHAYDAEDVELFQALAAQVAVAIDNAQFYESVRRNLQETEALFTFNQQVSQATDLPKIARAALEACGSVMEAAAGAVVLFDGEPPQWKPLAGIVDGRIIDAAETDRKLHEALGGDLLDGIIGWVLRERRPLRLDQAQTDPRYRGPATMHSELCVPIVSAGQAVGVITVESMRANAYDARHERFLETLSGQLAVAIESVRLRDAEQQRTRELAGLFEISQVFGAMDNPQATYAEVTRRVAQIFGVERAMIMVHDRASGRLIAQLPAYGIPLERAASAAYSLTALDGIWDLEHESYWLVNDVSQMPRVVRWAAARFRSRQWLAAAMFGREGLLGVLYIANRIAGAPFSALDGQLLSLLARQAALAVENARLYEEERASRQQLTLINQIGRRAMATLDLETLMYDLVCHVRETWGYHTVVMFFCEGAELVARASDGVFQIPSDYRQSIDEGIVGWVARHRQPRLAPDVRAAPDFINPPALDIRSEMTVPLLVRDELIGVMDVMSDRLDAFTASDVLAMQTIADQIAQAIVNARLYASEQRRAQQIAAVWQLGREIAAVLDLGELLPRSVTLIRESLAFDQVRLFLTGTDEHSLTLAAASPAMPDENDETLRRRARHWLHEVLAARRPLVARRTEGGADIPYAALPIRAGERLLGVLEVRDPRVGAFSADDLTFLQTVADSMAVALANAELHMEAERQARSDSLTGVFNHGYFLQRMREEVDAARASSQSLALIMLDIDFFKQYNDTYGHVIGDRVLQTTVQAIRQHIKKDDLVGRWGGEEFGVALLRARPEHALRVARRIGETLAALPLVDDKAQAIPKPTVSQGIAVFPDHASTSAALVELADRMLYVAKNRGRAQVILHHEDRSEQYRLPLEDE